MISREEADRAYTLSLEFRLADASKDRDAARAESAALAERLRLAEAVERAIEPFVEALFPFVEGGGNLHEFDCPNDDTCNCPEIVAFNTAERALRKAREEFKAAITDGKKESP